MLGLDRGDQRGCRIFQALLKEWGPYLTGRQIKERADTYRLDDVQRAQYTHALRNPPLVFDCVRIYNGMPPHAHKFGGDPIAVTEVALFHAPELPPRDYPLAPLLVRFDMRRIIMRWIAMEAGCPEHDRRLISVNCMTRVRGFFGETILAGVCMKMPTWRWHVAPPETFGCTHLPPPDADADTIRATILGATEMCDCTRFMKANLWIMRGRMFRLRGPVFPADPREVRTVLRSEQTHSDPFTAFLVGVETRMSDGDFPDYGPVLKHNGILHFSPPCVLSQDPARVVHCVVPEFTPPHGRVLA